jgi:pimeloyl-ACP methyl ester carboxylesterase
LGPIVGGGFPARLRWRSAAGTGARSLRGSTAIQEVADDRKDDAWRTRPSFYAVSTQDRTINPDLERFMAERMGAKTIEINASHLALISQPDAITNLIMEALAV